VRRRQQRSKCAIFALVKFADIIKGFTKKDLPQSEVELIGEVPFETVAPYREHALLDIAAEVEMPGFRKGHVPHDLVLKRVGEVAVLEEAVNHFVRDFYPELVDELKLDVVGRPNIAITKLAPGNPVGLTIRAALYPEVTLPKNWKSIAEKVPLEPREAATDEDVHNTLEQLRQSRKQGESVPELNDEFAKSIGAFETLEALREQIKKGITEEKARAARDKRRGKIIDAVLEKTTVEPPRIFVEAELDKILSQMQEDVARFGVKYDDYLKQINKTEEQLREEFREQAAKRAKLQLALNKIAADEKVEADPEAVEHEMQHALEHFPDARPELVRIHIETVLRNEKVLQLLEKTEEAK
jgi:FKBP-type peptidyl-prolyl cis-trans isomerase (trigger factor)